MDQLRPQVPDTAGTFGPEMRLLLTVEEAADRIGICRSNMFKLIRQGDVKSVKVGRSRGSLRRRWRTSSGGWTLPRIRQPDVPEQGQS